jgi:hypothetical protein
MSRHTPLLAAAFALGVLGTGLAQDAPAEKSPRRPTRFFDRPIDYWQSGAVFGEELGKDPKVPRKPEAAGPPSDWGQVVKLPDGTLAYQELPKPLVRILEDPSRENIRAYFEWRMSRARKVLRAAELMKEYKGAEAPVAQAGVEEPRAADRSTKPDKPAALPEPSVAAPAASSDFKVTYFHKQGCPHCDSQDAVLSEWLQARPQGRLEVVEFGTRPELWRAYQVRGTPSVVVEDAKSKKAVFLEGLSRAEALDRALDECRRPGEPNQIKKEK